MSGEVMHPAHDQLDRGPIKSRLCSSRPDGPLLMGGDFGASCPPLNIMWRMVLLVVRLHHRRLGGRICGSNDPTPLLRRRPLICHPIISDVRRYVNGEFYEKEPG
jgi:hypothetical protein